MVFSKKKHASMKINLCQMGVPDDPGITSHKFKCAKLARWVYASQQAIPSRVRELSKTIPIRVSKLHCCDPFFVPEASGHFYWFSGSSCVDSAVCIFIRFQCFECYKQNCVNNALGFMHLNKPYLLAFGSLQKPLPFVFKSFIVLIRFLFWKHLGIFVGFPEALV